VDYETLPRRARGQFLVGRTPNPGTAFYAGYNDDVTVSGVHRFTGLPDPGLRRYERVFFLKASYLFRLLETLKIRLRMIIMNTPRRVTLRINAPDRGRRRK
jgi:hypothetical protein